MFYIFSKFTSELVPEEPLCKLVDEVPKHFKMTKMHVLLERVCAVELQTKAPRTRADNLNLSLGDR